jgi:hypothetical protein
MAQGVLITLSLFITKGKGEEFRLTDHVAK